jgi:hypothetical protein
MALQLLDDIPDETHGAKLTAHDESATVLRKPLGFQPARLPAAHPAAIPISGPLFATNPSEPRGQQVCFESRVAPCEQEDCCKDGGAEGIRTPDPHNAMVG